MKKLVLFIVMFLFVGNVYAKDITLDDVVNVINDGVITEEFKESKLLELDDKTKEKLWNNISITAIKTSNGIEVSYAYSGKTVEVGSFTATMLDDGITLQSKISYKKDDDYKYENEIELHKLLVYWVIEASDGFSKVKEYLDKDYITFFDAVFNKCYRKDMHSCRTYVSNYGDYEYTSDVELNEGAVEYLIDYLKEEERNAKNTDMLLIIAGVGVVILILFIIAKSMEEPVKKVKY